MSDEEIKSKCEELSAKYKCEVTPIIFTVKDEQIVGYIQEPQYQVILYCQSAMANNKHDDAMEAAIKDCLLPESDPRMLSEERGNARIRASVALACLKQLTPYTEELKKK